MWTTGTVIERIDWNDKLFSLRIRADVEPFIAGQFIKLSQMRDDKRIARAYSIVNPPGKDYVEVLAVAVEDGQLSPDLQALKIGDNIEVTTKASGFMTLDEIPSGALQGPDLWFLATGTAVGPFISIMETAEPWQRFEKVVLVYGVRMIADLAYLPQLQALQQQYPEKFELIPIVTREEYKDGLSCRIPDGLSSGLIEQAAGVTLSQDNSQVLICGNPGMISDAQTVLIEKGLVKNLRRAPGQITVEKYW
ncbi:MULTISPECIES: ferredoxin--NADP reductase [unclassified Shewanella]|uniref:ferredoxin--NADP reductase n=1 Tax=unclassified Shewanella TaxID=196818 RepID=UPI000C84DB89|nr:MULTISPECIES: ferredoxin--NADP reductase [unclassified Shewanella]MDO6619741.1 ferredoxin--NADP reductase [Shewanella sp. 6_MG-2023]MDO6638671.1 ferredoxin--NADP reductase [Shewanella sp. 5_MG-2023]MDO6680124.1 ferredoxin--NADP reductase [Shewanella sp. 4_MG-2023]MDO6774509.1 ferredoxin--NADP reductase [Shewanella sp. 3_MG-2023]PMG32180.1 ferredoxin--NADP(+) reductase [Shewanella sp. 10N.286.52.C2]